MGFELRILLYVLTARLCLLYVKVVYIIQNLGMRVGNNQRVK